MTRTADWRRYTGTHAQNVGTVNSGFWGTVRSSLGKVAFVEDAVAMYYAAQDDATPRYAKVAIFAALAYFVCPLDLVTDAIPVLGWSDDAAVIAGALHLFRPFIKEEHRRQAKQLLTPAFLHERFAEGEGDAHGANDGRQPEPRGAQADPGRGRPHAA